MLKRSAAVLALAFGGIAVSGPAHATCRWTLVDGKRQQLCDDKGDSSVREPPVAPAAPPAGSPPVVSACHPELAPTGPVTRPMCP